MKTMGKILKLLSLGVFIMFTFGLGLLVLCFFDTDKFIND